MARKLLSFTLFIKFTIPATLIIASLHCTTLQTSLFIIQSFFIIIIFSVTVYPEKYIEKTLKFHLFLSTRTNLPTRLFVQS